MKPKISRFPALSLAVVAMPTTLNAPVFTARAVTFTVTPSAVSNTYSGQITLTVSGLASGGTVVVQKFLDLNTNGVIDGSDWLVQQFSLTDGQPGMVIGGIVNSNVPGDTDTTAGQITAKLNFNTGDIGQKFVGKYLFKVSGNFAPPLTNGFTVTNFPWPQKFTGTVVSNNTSTVVPNAVVFLLTYPNGIGVSGAVANNAGAYSIAAPAGTYELAAVRSNYLAAMVTVTLPSGLPVTTNLTMTNATASISGKLVDAANSNLGLPGMFMSASANGLIGVAFTDTNGNYTLRVQSGQWGIKANDSGLPLHGYLGLQNRTNVAAGTTGVNIALPKATALIYGSVKDSLGNPMAGIEMYANDQNNNLYEADINTDAGGNYFAGVVGFGGNDSWWVGVSSDSSPTNYIFSQETISGNISSNTAVLQNFTAVLATNYITGWLKDSQGNPISGVGIWANATIAGVSYQQQTDTDNNGNYSLTVANSNSWSVGVNNCSDCSDGLPSGYVPPGNQTVGIANNNGVANFIALRGTNSISGYLKDNNNNQIGNVWIWGNATVNGGTYQTGASTDGSGHFLFSVLNSNTWTVGVSYGGGGGSLPSDYVSPFSQTVVISNNNAVVNFTALLATNYITGWLKDNNNNPISGVDVSAGAIIGGVNYQNQVATDGSGNYSLNVANATWTVGVFEGSGNGSLPDIYLGPPQQTVMIASHTGSANFTALLATNHLTGLVQDSNGNPIPGAGVYANAAINGVSYARYADTDANGNYSMNVANTVWTVNLAPTPGDGSDSLDSLLGSGNYIQPDDVNVTINDNDGTANFTVQLLVGVASKPLQNLFVADVGGSIYEFATNGTRSTFASGLNGPIDLAFDKAGNLFEADSGSGQIYKFATSGTRATFASGLNKPYALAFDRNGNLFEGDFGSGGHIYKFTPGGTQSYFGGSAGGCALAFDSAGNLFADGDPAHVYEYAPNGGQSTFAGGMNIVNGLAYDRAGDLFVADGSGNIYEFTNNAGTLNPNPVTFCSGLTFPCGVAFWPPATIAAPCINSCCIAGANLVVNAANGVAGKTYHLLASTNLMVPVNQWLPVATNALSGDGSFTITATNVIVPSTRQKFFIRQSQ
jgi:hypothetical protein